jgi:hypothetical protein
MAKKKSGIGSNTFEQRKKKKRRYNAPPLHHRKKLTPSQSRMKRNGSL